MLSPEESRQIKENDELLNTLVGNRRRAQIQLAYVQGVIGVTADEVGDFLEAFASIVNNSDSRICAAPPGFEALVRHHGMTEQELLYLSLILVQNKLDEGDKYWGRKLLDSLSATGYVEATIRIVNNALVQAANKPGVLKQAAVAIERGRLQAIARKREHIRAMVLEGKICYFLGDSTTAIRWWWDAVEGSVDKSQSIMSRLAAGEKLGPDIAAMDRSDLSAPWIELIEAHFDRSLKQGKKEWDQCEKAIKIGMAQDDPTAFYYAATYYKKRNEDGSHSPTSDWLYYMTKAAASGVPKAAYELAVYYAESGWKYLENEPPDHVKPTPFDTWPAPDTNESLWSKIRRRFAAVNQDQIRSGDDMFHTAVWPPTAEQRQDLAIKWLDVAASYMYAPTFLYWAKLSMQETLWAGAYAPKEAIALDPKRCQYDSETGLHEAQFSGDHKPYEAPDDAKDPPNPRYSLARAKEMIREVMYARAAVSYRQKLIEEEIRSQRTQDVTWDDIDKHVRLDTSHDISKFHNNSDIYDMWKDESEALYKEATDICDAMKWNIYDKDEALIYKHRA